MDLFNAVAFYIIHCINFYFSPILIMHFAMDFATFFTKRLFLD